MRMSKKLAAGMFGMACLAMAAMPSTAFAQRQGGGGGGGGGGGQGGRRGGGMMGGGQTVMLAQQAATTLDGVTDDEKTKIQGIVDDYRKQMQDARQGMADLSQEDRAAKMKELAKTGDDTVDKIAGALTDDQKATFAGKFSTTVVTNAETTVTAMTKTAEGFDTSDDNKAALKTLFTDTTKKLDGFKTDATSVKDMAASKELNTKVTDTMTDVRKQIGTILGNEDAQKFNGEVMRNMPRGGGQGGRNGGGAGGAGGGRRSAGGGNTPTPTTAPTL